MKLELPRATGEKKPQLAASSRWAQAAEVLVTDGLIATSDLKTFAGSNVLLLGKSTDGKYIGVRDDRHCLTVAGSRAGKGTSLIVPNLALYGGSILCIDPKGENAKITAARRRAMGQRVYVLDPFQISGDAELATYNPFADLDETKETLIDDAALLADSLIADRNQKDPHWDDAARELIKGIILYIKLKIPFEDQKHLILLREILSNPKKLDTALTEMAAATEADGVMAASAVSFALKPDKERDSVLSNALRHTEFLDSPGMKRVLRDSAGLTPLPSLRCLRTHHRFAASQAVTVYLCLPATRMPTHSRWLRLMISFALALFEQDAQEQARDERPPGPPVLFLMDEFATLGHLPAMTSAAGLVAGYGIKLWPFLQDLSQLQHHYEKGWETFVGNAGLEVFFGNSDLTTLRHVSERLGKVRLPTASVTTGGMDARGTTNHGETTTPLLSTDEVQRYFARRKNADDYLILLLQHSVPIYLQKVPYFRDAALMALLNPSTVPAPAAPAPRGFFGGLLGK